LIEDAGISGFVVNVNIYFANWEGKLGHRKERVGREATTKDFRK
jgi:hypothetical protein